MAGIQRPKAAPGPHREAKARPAAPVQRAAKSRKKQRFSPDQQLLILEDVDNGHEYYMVPVDHFSLEGRTYAALYSYELDDGNHRKPELVLMRSSGGGREQYYQSIRSKKELEAAFNAFFARIEQNY